MLKANSNCPDWISYASKVNLTVPSHELMEVANVMDKEFKKFHSEYFSK